MKNSFAILLLLGILTEGKLYPPSFPKIRDMKKNSDEVFRVACGHSWSIYTTLPEQTSFHFPQDLLSLNFEDGFNISINCSTDQKSMNLTFLAPMCRLYPDLEENPIIFEIYEKQANSSKVKFRRTSSCLMEIDSKEVLDTGYIGNIDDKMWYLLHRSNVSQHNNSLIRFALIIFKSDSQTTPTFLNDTLKEVNTDFFNGLLPDISSDFLSKKIGCVLYYCYKYKTSGFYPPTFPAIHDSNKNSDEIFQVACGNSWSILATILPHTGYTFPEELMSLKDNPGFTVNAECSSDQKSMKLTFLSPKCEEKYENMTENPIQFELYDKEVNSSKIKFRRISSCLKVGMHLSYLDTGNIGHVNDKIWYLLHWSNLGNTEDSNIRFALIIFGRDTEDSGKVLNNTLNHIFTNFFNGFFYDLFDDLHRKSETECELTSCYKKKVILPILNSTGTTSQNVLYQQTRHCLILRILLFIGTFLLCHNFHG